MKKAVAVILLLSLMVVAFSITTTAIDVVLEPEPVTEKRVYLWKKFYKVYDDTISWNDYYKNIVQFCSENMNFSAVNGGEGNYTSNPISMNLVPTDNDYYNNIFGYGLNLSWRLNEDYNRPEITVSVVYKQYISSVTFMPMQFILLDFVYVNDSSFVDLTTPYASHYNSGTIYLFSDIENEVDSNLWELLTYRAYYPYVYDDDEVIEDIQTGDEQTDYKTFLHNHLPISLSGIKAIFNIASISIMTSHIQAIISIFVFGGMSMTIVKYVTRSFGGKDYRKKDD